MKYSLIDNIAYRGDTRPPSDIFRNGFWNKQTPEFLWREIAIGEKDYEMYGFKLKVLGGTLTDEDIGGDTSKLAVTPLQSGQMSYRVYLKTNPLKYINVQLKEDGSVVRQKLYIHYARNQPQYRDETYWQKKEPYKYGKLIGEALTKKLKGDRKTLEDINPESAVCLTLRPEVAPFFPLEGSDVHGNWVWIYAMYVSAAIKTYNYQNLRGANVSFAREIAVEHVPASHVLCAVRCWRRGKYPDMEFNFTPRIYWNRWVLSDIRMRWGRRTEIALSKYIGYTSWCPNTLHDTIIYKQKLIFAPF